MLKSVTFSNLLSFGPQPTTLVLGGLNLLIGPNGSGKSNFIEAIGLLRSAPKELVVPVREGGGVAERLWKKPGRQAKSALVPEVPAQVTEL